VVKSVIAGCLLGVLGAAGPWLWLKSRQARRLRELIAQLPDAIDILSTTLRTGFSFLRGVQLIATQMQPPISEEFRRVAAEVQLGMSIDEALEHLVDRTRCYDLELLVAAVQIQLEVGGNLSEILDTIAYTIRERAKLQGEIAAATAETRLSAAILLAMPIVIAFVINAMNPGYLKPLFTTPVGMAMALLAAVLMAVGAIVIRKIADVDL
ncbi:MAG: type II secretion system F family protein, partial [Armatimonadetes bacterium]|nr:type II secretion system F family protein [Armatimonadota bacterium]